MAQVFDPSVSALNPTASSRPDHLGTVRIDLGDQRVHILFYEKRKIRVRVNEPRMVINECYLQGGKNEFTILGLRPDES